MKDEKGETLASDASVKFPATKVDGKASKTLPTIGNDGLGDLTGLVAKVSGPGKRDFPVSFKSGSLLAPGATRTLEIEFEPPRAGKRSATLRLTSNDPDTPLHQVTLRTPHSALRTPHSALRTQRQGQGREALRGRHRFPVLARASHRRRGRIGGR